MVPETTPNRTGARATLPLLLAALAAAALLLAPHAVLVTDAQGGTTTELRFWWDQAAADADVEPVPGAAAAYGLVASLVLVAGAALTFVGLRRDRHGLLVGGTATFLAGAVTTVHYAALWTGRLLATAVHAVAGYDAPPLLLQQETFADDAFSHVWTIGPAVALGLTLAAAVLLARAVASRAAGEHDARDQAHRHLRTAWLSLVVLAMLFAVPWSAQSLPDNQTGFDGARPDDDTFWVSPYDAFRFHEGTSAAAEQTNRGALVQYDDLLALLWTGLAATAVVALAATLGTHGALRSAAGDRNLGNLWQSSAYGGILAVAALTVVVLLAGLWLHRPNADAENHRATFVGLAALAPAVLAALSQIAVVRQLAGESGTLLADDFPETIVYD